VLVIDENGISRRAASRFGVQRQYTGTAGRIENAQVAVYLVPVAACFVGGLLAIWWAEVIRRGR
jgi:SRSO17 transposase